MPDPYFGQALAAGEIGSNLLALPNTIEQQYSQALNNRRLIESLAPTLGIEPAAVEQLAPLPSMQHFPGMNVPILGGILRGIGTAGQLLQTVLGNAPAPRPPLEELGLIARVRQEQQSIDEAKLRDARDERRLNMEQRSEDWREKNYASLISSRIGRGNKNTSIYADDTSPTGSSGGGGGGGDVLGVIASPTDRMLGNEPPPVIGSPGPWREGFISKTAADDNSQILDAAGVPTTQDGTASSATPASVPPGRWLNQNALKQLVGSADRSAVASILMAKGDNLDRFRSEDFTAAVDEVRLAKKTQKLPQGFGKIAADVGDVREVVRMMDDLRSTVDKTPDGHARLKAILRNYTPQKDGSDNPNGPITGRWHSGLYGTGFENDPIAVKLNTLAQRIALMGASTIMRRSGTRAYQAMQAMQQHFSQPYDNDVEFLTKLDTNRTSLLNGAEEAVNAAMQDPASMLKDLQGMETQPYGGLIKQPTATGTEGPTAAPSPPPQSGAATTAAPSGASVEDKRALAERLAAEVNAKRMTREQAKAILQAQ